MTRKLLHSVTLVALVSIHAVASAAEPPIVQPGAPGAATQDLTPDAAVAIADTSYSAADVRFMQDMIPHHHQALVMSRLAPERTNNPDILDLAGRIDGSQADEIAFMQSWLAERGEDAPDPSAHAAMHTHHDMAGMASPEQMAELAASKATAFDRLFLTLMIPHHDGAVKMVEELLEQPGAAYDPILYEYTSDITNDQSVEIERMNALLIGLSDDPRAGLSAGLTDAGEAISNLELVTSLRKPVGFFDPANPAGRGAEKPKDDEEEKEGEAAATGDAAKEDEEDVGKPVEKAAKDRRYPMLSFSNTDMAFRDDVLVAGSYHGFNVYRIGENGVPGLLSSIVCPGGQGDVSIVGDLLIMSVEQTRGRLDCGLQGVGTEPSDERFRGLRIFDISDLTRPVQVGAVQTCRGSHTHSVVTGPEPDGKIIVYNSGTSSVREEEELDGCVDDIPGDDRTALFRIDVIEIPVADPSKSRIVASPTVFADPETGVLAGLWRGGDHGDDTQETRRTDQCHDITVFPAKQLAAGACSGNGILFDISDPINPKRLDVVTDEGFAYWHSATFNNDGTKVLFTDEWGGGSRPRCRAWDPLDWGADAIYDIENGKLEYRSHYKMSAPQVESENCVAHNGSIVPVPGRDIFVQAWYQGGISIIDFTDSANPVEIAYFDRGPIIADELVTGGFWSVYFYEGYIYGTEIIRGLDVFKLTPSEYLSEAEITAAALARPAFGPRRLFNPQQQMPVTWPPVPVVAQAYVEQLESTGVLPDAVTDLLIQAEAALGSGGDAALAKEIAQLVGVLPEEDELTGRDAQRLASLTRTLGELAALLARPSADNSEE